MTELSLRFTSNHEQTPDGPLQVALFWPQSGTASDPQPFTPPLDDQQLADLRWYLEVFSTWPTGPDYARARRIESELEEWGRKLRRSAIHGEAAVRIWQQFVDADGEKLLTIDADDPRVLRLPWELLADEGGHLFSQGVSVRRRLRQTQRAHLRELSLPVRILVLVARPDDAGFIDPRAITRPLLDAVAGLGDAVAVEFLPRPTLQALSQRLRDRDAPPVHVVHFDGHGVYDQKMGLGYLLFEKDDHQSDRVDANRLGTLLNQTGVPLMALNACQSAAQAEANPYASVAARLIRAGVGSVLAMNYAVLVVAAHKFTAAFYAALAAGRSVGGAVEAGRFALLEDVDRHTLTRRTADDKLVDETIRLYDWFLPALYQQADDPVIFTPPPAGGDEARPAGAEPPGGALAAEPLPVQTTYPRLVQLLRDRFDEEELRELCFKLRLRYADVPGATRAAKARELTALLGDAGRLPELVAAARAMRPDPGWDAALDPSVAARALAPHPSSPTRSSPPRPLADLPATLPPPPRHGFHGRSRELLDLERAFNAYPIVVLHGFGGLGKTALAAEAGRWFRRTGRFPGGAAFVSFEQGGSLAQLCSWVGQTLSGDPDWVIHGEGDLAARVGELLAEKPALLILDNFESVLGKEPLMPAAELKTVLEAVYQWATVAASPPRPLAPSPASRVLITTRDTTFNDARFAPSRACRHVALRGLAPAEALALAAAVLDDHGIDRAQIGREELQTLLEQLGGHPLSLNLVLPHLRDHTPAALTARFEALLPGFVTGAAQERNESLAVSLDFSLRRLGAATRAALPDLAVFQGGCLEVQLLEITQMGAELWQAARAELEQAALVTVESIPGVNPPFLRFHPTLLPYLATQLDADRRAELETRYRQRYYALAGFLYESDTQTPHQARAIAQRELPNLRRALDLALAAGELETAVDFADRIARFLDNFGRWRERDAMLAKVSDEFKVMLNLTKSYHLTISKSRITCCSSQVKGSASWNTGK